MVLKTTVQSCTKVTPIPNQPTTTVPILNPTPALLSLGEVITQSAAGMQC